MKKSGGKGFIREVAVILLSGMLALLLLSVFCCFYNYSGIHRDNPELFTDYIWGENQWKVMGSEGYAAFKMDRNGFNNAPQYVYDKDMDLLVMGDSYMEALNVPQDKNMTYLLNEKGIKTYNIGVSAHVIYNCVQNVKAASDRFNPDHILIYTDSVSLKAEDMLAVLNQVYDRIPSHTHGPMYYLQKIPALKPIRNNLHLWRYRGHPDLEKKDVPLNPAINNIPGIGSIPGLETKPGTNELEVPRGVYDQILTAFLTIAKESTDSDITILFGPLYELDNRGLVIDTAGEDEDEYEANYDSFVRVCEELGIQFIDANDAFQTAFYRDHVVPYGFSNTILGEGHLNQYGHAVLADLVAQSIQ